MSPGAHFIGDFIGTHDIIDVIKVNCCYIVAVVVIEPLPSSSSVVSVVAVHESIYLLVLNVFFLSCKSTGDTNKQ